MYDSLEVWDLTTGDDPLDFPSIDNRLGANIDAARKAKG